jgi:5-methylcytosine-specific restriction endonuclease McrA
VKDLTLCKLLCNLRAFRQLPICQPFSTKGVAFPKFAFHTPVASAASLASHASSHNRAASPEQPPYSLGGRVLVLNQSYEPISVCNIKKAMTLLFLMKAEIVVTNEKRKVRSIRNIFACPSVIRLRRYIHVPVKKVELSRKNILRRDNHQCQYCGTPKAPLTIDHVMPKSRAGMDTWENLVCACVKCNTKKGNHTPDEAGMKLLKTPRRPSHVTFIKNIGGEVDEGWKPYLFMT